MSSRILLADDQPDVRSYLAGILAQGGYDVVEAESAEEALEILTAEDGSFLGAILDVDFGQDKMRGTEAVDVLRLQWPYLPCILLSSSGTTEEVVQSVRKGATAFLEKGLYVGEVLPIAVGQIDYVRRLRSDLLRARAEIRPDWRRIRIPGYSSIEHLALIGKSAGMTQLRDQLTQLATESGSVLFVGEPGSGRKHAAASVHFMGVAGESPLIHIHCQSLDDRIPSLLTAGGASLDGQSARKENASETAEEAETDSSSSEGRATVVLCEVQALSSDQQDRLLEEIRKIPATIRILATATSDLQDPVSGGVFRKDLRDEIAGKCVNLSPLRERREDLPELIAHFSTQASMALGRSPIKFSDEAMSAFSGYPFLGNLRELRAVIEQAAFHHGDGEIEIFSLPPHVLVSEEGKGEPAVSENIRRRAYIEALSAASGDVALAATALGRTEDEIRDAVVGMATQGK